MPKETRPTEERKKRKKNDEADGAALKEDDISAPAEKKIKKNKYIDSSAHLELIEEQDAPATSRKKKKEKKDTVDAIEEETLPFSSGQKQKSKDAAKSEAAAAEEEAAAKELARREYNLKKKQDFLERKKEDKKRKAEDRARPEESDKADAAAADTADVKVDWAARRLEKEKRKKERLANLAEEAKAALKAKTEEKAAREKANEALKQKGKLTKKQKYLAAKAAKKAAVKQGTEVEFKLEDAMAAANVTKVDPKALSCFLTGLPYAATEKHVADHFSDVGPSTVHLLQDKVNNRPNGTGFITFSKAEHALHACMYNGSKIQGRWFKVRLCEPRDSGMGSSIRAPDAKPEGCLSVVVKCDTSISEASLKRFFADCEASNVSRMMTDGEFRGTAFIDFEETAMVDKAVKKNGQTIKGHTILVRYKAEKKSNPGGESSGRVAAHNRAAPVPPPSGTVKKFDSESDSE